MPVVPVVMVFAVVLLMVPFMMQVVMVMVTVSSRMCQNQFGSERSERKKK
jgi:hypothetical protein